MNDKGERKRPHPVFVCGHVLHLSDCQRLAPLDSVIDAGGVLFDDYDVILPLAGVVSRNGDFKKSLVNAVRFGYALQ